MTREKISIVWFKENSAKVFNKLGSRKNNASLKRIKQRANKDQLSLID